VVGTRRALLGAGLAGGGALLTGCGDEAQPPVRESDVLARQLTATQAVVAAYGELTNPPELHALASRARAREQRLQVALRAAGGKPAAAAPAPAEPSVDAALAAQRRALAAHVAAVGELHGAAPLALLTGLVTGAAEDEAVLAGLLGRNPLANPFPGEPL
jgi:hypothetical protein